MIMEKFPYSQHPARVISCGPISSGKTIFATSLVLNTINDYDKNNFYSPSLHQDFNQKIFKCSSNYIPIHIIPNTLNEEDIDVVIDEIVNDKDFNKSELENEIYESIEE